MDWKTLPAWIYANDEFFALEGEAIFMRTWQLVGHLCDIPKSGDYLRFDLLTESAIVVRGHDGTVRAFHNVCRHRAFRLVDGAGGHCQGLIRCRYHGFSYAFDGALKAVPAAEEFEGLDFDRFGLKPIDLEIWRGFIFVRFAGDGPSVTEQFAPVANELDAYRFDQLEPCGNGMGEPMAADWKVAIDNNIEGYHIPVAHPALQRLYGHRYRFVVHPLGVSHAGGPLRDTEGSTWSERHYLRLLPEVAHLPEERRRFWGYYSMFPNLAFDVYPDLIDFFQILPTAPGRSVSRWRAYALRDERREMRAARWLNMRINAWTTDEDRHLVEGVQAGLGSRSYETGLLSRKEARVRQFHDMVRSAVPVAALDRAPARGTIAEVNADMSKQATSLAAR